MPVEWTLNLNLVEKAAAVKVRLGEVVQETAAEIDAELKHKITEGSKSGRVYLSGPSPLPHQASAPGESPANWTGELVESIHHEATGPMSAEVHVDANYAHILEFGGAKVSSRPFFYPTLEEAKPEFRAKVEAILKETL
jgi:HK97 gp10 family phage protein